MKSPNQRGNPHTGFNGGRSDSRWAEYSARKQKWVERHPDATSREIDEAARVIARTLGL